LGAVRLERSRFPASARFSAGDFDRGLSPRFQYAANVQNRSVASRQLANEAQPLRYLYSIIQVRSEERQFEAPTLENRILGAPPILGHVMYSGKNESTRRYSQPLLFKHEQTLKPFNVLNHFDVAHGETGA
jgi:hypothetical protein